MFRNIDEMIITQIVLAIHVKPDEGAAAHANRPFHGLALSADGGVREYLFSDGTRLLPRENDLLYLPKGSTYRVNALKRGSCYAINFDLALPLQEAPFIFTLPPRSYETALKSFQEAASLWQQQSDLCNAVIRRNLYDILLNLQRDQQHNYHPRAHELLLAPAMEQLQRDFTRNSLSVKELAARCGVSEAYFRRLFTEIHSVSPKEYLLNLRTEYAKRLLSATTFSIAQIAQMCGYGEPCHFSREFSRRTGFTPREYRKIK